MPQFPLPKLIPGPTLLLSQDFCEEETVLNSNSFDAYMSSVMPGSVHYLI